MEATYYIKDSQGRICAHAQYKFQEDCKETTEQIIMGSDGFYYLKGQEPPKPEPTVFEKIAEVQAPFLEQQTLAKSDFIAARIEGDAELEAEAQADYQASIDAMKLATSEVTGG